MSAETKARVLLLPPHVHFPAAMARFICAEHGAAAPDYSGLTLVTPTPALTSALAAALSRAGGGAVMSPALHTLASFIAPALPAETSTELGCRIRIAEAVTRFRHLFPDQTPLSVAEALYALFDELAQNQIALPGTEEDLRAFLQAGYGATRPLAALSREAEIVHSLYQAFLEDVGERAPAVAERLALAATLRGWPAARPLIFAGFDSLSPAAAAAIGAALASPNVAFITQGRLEGRDAAPTCRLFQQLGVSPSLPAVPPASPRSQLLDAAFAVEGPALARATAGKGGQPDGLRFAPASNAEHEAQMADLAVRQALLGGAKNIAVIAGDRRLARRLRARLERANVRLTDRGGWALSTSRAAAALNSWLSCVEENFPFRAVMDLLKSGTLAGGAEWAEALEPRAFKEKIVGGWIHWRKHANSEAEAERWEHLQRAQQCIGSLRGAHPAARHAEGLIASLEQLGLSTEFAHDDAGGKLLAVLADLHAALANSRLTLSWRAFRALLDKALEDASFTVSSSGAVVQLLTLAQTQGLAADVVIVTGATAQLLATTQRAPFFNSGVRRELGLATPEQAQALALARLRRVLEAAPQVEVLYAPAEAGEQAQPAAALIALKAFATACGAPIPFNSSLAQRAPLAEIARASPLPATTTPPMPAAGSELVRVLFESGLSAGGHNALIECPYRFHAQYGLRLSDPKAPDDPSDRSDYGHRVHSVLHAFYQPLPDCAPPYEGPFGAAQIPAIAAHLHLLADGVFAADVALRPLGRAWRAEFGQAVPWLAEQMVASGEAAVRVELELLEPHEGLTLKGAIDRLEELGPGRRVVDYKTGNVPKAGLIKSGESVQLPHYAVAVNATAIAYWDIKEQKQQELADSELAKLKDLLSARLQALAARIKSGAPLPAHGAPSICRNCEYHGLCRNAAEVRAVSV